MTPWWMEVRKRRAEYPSPARFADYLLRWCEITVPPVDLNRIAEKLDVRVERAVNPGWSGAVESDPASGIAKIWLNRAESAVRQRFTLAHELGHLLLHDGKQFRDASFSGGPQESQANRFAAALLMPFWMLEPYGPLRSSDAETLAIRFGVSPHAMRIRIADMFGHPVEW